MCSLSVIGDFIWSQRCLLHNNQSMKYKLANPRAMYQQCQSWGSKHNLSGPLPPFNMLVWRVALDDVGDAPRRISSMLEFLMQRTLDHHYSYADPHPFFHLLVDSMLPKLHCSTLSPLVRGLWSFLLQVLTSANMSIVVERKEGRSTHWVLFPEQGYPTSFAL